MFLASVLPLGLDGLPFTEDDGLRVLSHSPAANLGGGALGTYGAPMNWPTAHFVVSNPHGWFEDVGTNYNPTWTDLPATVRGQLRRPWDTSPSFGTVPQTVTFDAALSMSGYQGSTTNTAITDYVWDFGDGTLLVTNAPLVEHTFTDGGTRLVVLTVTNTLGTFHATSNLWAFEGVATPGQPWPRVHNLNRIRGTGRGFFR